ncbi:PREDICTED: DNA-binding protein HEXBP-like [Ipomoea nil]|uniref:DNA-binding protein HEXBP-like n=1 Tax=Ipomoea nil TaxID=35883 RepID=UPI0009014FD4|nr:PREDICTED: DNA-binding protein HEXBP-like [Ipomoea nil]
MSRPSSLKDAYVSAADLYRVQQLQRGSYELARKRTESGGSSTYKKPRPSFQAKNASSPTQGPNRMEQGNQAKAFPCRRCGKVHAGQDCNGFAFRCFRCGDKGHKTTECPQQANQRALPPPPGAGGAVGGSSSRGAAGAKPSGRVFVMGRSQAETEGLVEEELAGNPFLAYPCL